MKQWNSQGVENRCFVTAEPDGAQMLAPHPQVVRTGKTMARSQQLHRGSCVRGLAVSRQDYRLGVQAAETAGN